MNELARAVKEAMGAPDHPVQNLPERNEVRHAFSDHSKATAVFGSTGGTPLDVGLERMARWAREHGARRTPRFAEIEVARNLPPSWLEDGE